MRTQNVSLLGVSRIARPNKGIRNFPVELLVSLRKEGSKHISNTDTVASQPVRIYMRSKTIPNSVSSKGLTYPEHSKLSLKSLKTL